MVFRVGLKSGRIKIAKVDIAALLALVAALISQTVPSSSTRPNRCGSLAGCVANGWGAGRGPELTGRGPGRGPGRGAGLGEALLAGSSAVMRSHHPSATVRAAMSAHPPRVAAPVGSLTVSNSIQAAWRAPRAYHLAAPGVARSG